MHGMMPDGRVLDNGRPIVAVDIDGTLADYHGWFLRFAEGYLGKIMPNPSEMNPGLPLHEFMGLTKDEYRQVKLAYRQGGLKRSMPVFEGASHLTKTIERYGAEVWVCTTRPYLRLDNIDPDTREWLHRHGIQYTALLFGDSKYEDLVDSVGADRIVAVVEDLPEMVGRAEALGLTVLVPDRPYNKSIPERHQTLDAIKDRIILRIADWEAKHNNENVEVEIVRPGLSAGETMGTEGLFQKSQSMPLAESDYERDREERWADIVDNAFELFIRKSRDYGKAGDTLGARGQFADIWRKVGKIKNQIWDNPNRAINFEDTEEILYDLIGHAILFIDYLKAGNK